MAKKLSRRAFLGGAAVAVGLPLLDAMAPVQTVRGAPHTTATRLLCYYLPNGMVMPTWTPSGEGNEFVLGPTLSGLGAHTSEIVVVSGLENAGSDPGAPGHHAAGTAGFLTAALARKTELAPHLATSIDQLFAATQMGQTPLTSLQLGTDGGVGLGDCDNGYACAYSRSISWASPTTPMPKVTSPSVAFDLLFGGLDPTATAAEQAIRKHRRKSVLDAVRGDAKRLQASLGHGDRTKLDAYLEGVRALELRIQQNQASCAGAEVNRAPADFVELVAAMTDIMVLAFRCDATRVISWMLGNSASQQAYPFLGVSDAHHDLSHHAGDPAKLAALQTIEAWEVAQFAALLTKLRNVPEGEGTLLDNCLVLLSSEISDSNSHSHKNLPVVLAGRAGGALETGRHLVYPQGTAYGDLLVSVLDAVGGPSGELRDRGYAALGGL